MFANYIKTGILLGALSGLLLGAGMLLGGTDGLTIALIMALIMNGVAYFFSDKIVLNLYKAKALDPVKYKKIYAIIEELSGVLKIPMPKLWLIDTPMANAFATGRNPSHASVAVTTGILSILDEDELRGVLAHELSHVKNRDILISSVAAVIATAISYLGTMARYAAFFGSSQQQDGKRRGNVLGSLIVAIVVPIAATLIQLAISRSREYGADETGAHCSKDPLALASALEKLQKNIPQAHLRSDDTTHAASASLFIVNPFLGETIMSLFSTHPPMSKRIERLQRMHEKM